MESVHGEYKVSGGKLVAVDLEVEDEVIVAASLSGDFFLEPDSALPTVSEALLGMPITSSVEDLAHAITAVTPGVNFIGFNPEAVGIAVRRALGHSIAWHDLEFDVIHHEPQHPAMHIALDEVLAHEVAAGRRKAAFVIWEFNAPLVVIGSFQSVRNEIDQEALERQNMMVVRRISGGGAMFMESGNTITYSLVVPSALVDGLSFERSYSFLDEWVISALKEVGVNATYVPLNDIASDKGKIGGAAQKRFASGVTLHHVTMAYDIDADKMLDVLRIGREKLSDKGIKSANKRVDPMRAQTGMTREAIIDSLIAHFESRYKTQKSDFTAAELAEAERLVNEKFLSDEWTYRVP